MYNVDLVPPDCPLCGNALYLCRCKELAEMNNQKWRLNQQGEPLSHAWFGQGQLTPVKELLQLLQMEQKNC